MFWLCVCVYVYECSYKVCFFLRVVVDGLEDGQAVVLYAGASLLWDSVQQSQRAWLQGPQA